MRVSKMLEFLPTTSLTKIGCASFIVCCFLFAVLYKDENTTINYAIFFTSEFEPPDAPINVSSINNTKPEYLVASSKCKIPNLDPFDPQAKEFYHPEKYTPCRKLDLLTYVTKTDNTATLHVKTEIVPSYTKNGVTCCYSTVVRTANKDTPDDHIRISKCTPFKNNVTLPEDTVKVACKDSKTKKQLYENTHTVILPSKIKQTLLLDKNNDDNNKTEPATSAVFSVLFVGIDSISRLNFIRALPLTHEYLEQNHWIGLKGYNKMDDNTFPNVMAILTGYNQSRAYSLCNPKQLHQLDKCPMLWYDYKKLGYVTGYAEDEATINTFNYNKKGFTHPPTDFYFRPYMLASEKLAMVRKDGMNYCTGPETSGERILNLAKDFAVTFKNRPSFGFFWMNSFSHNELNSPTGMDGKVKQFLEDLTDNGVLNNSIVVFLSDHGIRFGEIRYRPIGWLEERLPFIYISIPKRFQDKFPQELANLKDNAGNKLTTPYDLHMTLQHIIELSGLNFTERPSDACANCTSLFKPIPSERSCEDAGIEQHWCTCTGYSPVDRNNETVKEAVAYVIGKIHQRIDKQKYSYKCAKYTLSKVIAASISETLGYKNDTYLLLVFQTKPKAVFEATVLYEFCANEKLFSLQGQISRLDMYGPHGHCMNDANLKKYCYCR